MIRENSWLIYVVVAFAKKTGDYAVLSQTDMSVIALTCQYEIAANGEKYVRSHPGEKKAAPPSLPNNGGGNKPKAKGKGKEKETEAETKTETETEGVSSENKVAESQADGSESGSDEDEEAAQEDEERVEELVDRMESVKVDTASEEKSASKATKETPKDDGHDSDDAGDWITPANVSKHRSRDLGLVPAGSGSDQAPLAAACMTGDYAVQNVLLSMGLGLIGEAGKRINKVKSFILRCHACFK